MLRQVRQTVLEALENQDVSVRPRRRSGQAAARAGRHPVFQVMFVYQQRERGGARVRPRRRRAQSTRTSRPGRPSSTSPSLPPSRARGWRRSSNTGPTCSTPRRCTGCSVTTGELLESIVARSRTGRCRRSSSSPQRSGAAVRRWQGERAARSTQRPGIVAQIADRAESAPDAVAVVGGRTHD